ncbi:MAG: hypothetical protein CL504_07820 [Actinobacteria bacterium]|jgi:ribonuclease D|nr:hypothetical protein [Actinomycetota bacterium]
MSHRTRRIDGSQSLGTVTKALAKQGDASNQRIKANEFTWIDEQSVFDSFVEELTKLSRVGIDTEFHREKTYWANLALIQIVGDNGIVLVDPVAVDIKELSRVLDGPATIVMHAASQDLEVLGRACGTIPRHIFDTQIAAGFLGMSTPSLASLVEKYNGVQLAKGDRLTDWFERPLTATQQAYAASDVAYLFSLHDQITANLSRLGRLEWALDECERSKVPNKPLLTPELAWTRIKEARHLRGQAKAVAASLAEWRERKAQANDIPPRFVLSDLALVGVAQQSPRDIESLKKIRGLDHRYLKDGGANSILNAVSKGRALKPEDVATLPNDDRPALGNELKPAVALVSAWVAQLARNESLDPALLATKADIVDFLSGFADSRLNKGWRRNLVGTRIHSLVNGKAALAFDREIGLILEARTV